MNDDSNRNHPSRYEPPMHISDRFKVRETNAEGTRTFLIPNIDWKDIQQNVPLAIFVFLMSIGGPSWGIVFATISLLKPDARVPGELGAIGGWSVLLVLGYFFAWGKVLGWKRLEISTGTLVVEEHFPLHTKRTSLYGKTQDVRIEIVPAKNASVLGLENVKLLLHSNGATTEVCAHKSREDMKRITQAVEGFFANGALPIDWSEKTDAAVDAAIRTRYIPKLEAFRRSKWLSVAVGLHVAFCLVGIAVAESNPGKHLHGFWILLLPVCILLMIGGRFYTSPGNFQGRMGLADWWRHCPAALRALAIAYTSLYFAFRLAVQHHGAGLIGPEMLGWMKKAETFFFLMLFDIDFLSVNWAFIRKEHGAPGIRTQPMDPGIRR